MILTPLQPAHCAGQNSAYKVRKSKLEKFPSYPKTLNLTPNHPHTLPPSHPATLTPCHASPPTHRPTHPVY